MRVISLFLDISGFTAMTDSLISRGKSGTETLSQIINSVFKPLLSVVYAAGGFVTTFAGDAFTAVFPLEGTAVLSGQNNPDAKQVLAAAAAMLRQFHDKPLHRTPWGEFLLKAKVGIGCGSVQWGILQDDDSAGYYFRGPGIDSAAEAEHHCQPGDLAITADLEVDISEAGSELPRQLGNYLVLKPDFSRAASAEGGLSNDARAALEIGFPQETASLFMPLRFLPGGSGGEFREIVSVFISFDDRSIDLDTLFSSITRNVQRSGGYFNLIDFGDKGGVALVLFGAPVSLEFPVQQALDFTWNLRTEVPELRIGISRGPCYAGYVGSELRSTYTALGGVVNLSARLAMSAEGPEILVQESLIREVSEGYGFEALKPLTLKGFAEPQPLARFVKREHVASGSRETGVGRRTENELLSDAVQRLAQGYGFGTIIVSGEAGIGKSQLLSDVMSGLDEADRPHTIFLRYDDLNRGFLRPVADYIGGVLEEYQIDDAGRSPEQMQKAFEKLRLDLQAGDGVPDFLINEMNRALPPLMSMKDEWYPSEPSGAMSDYSQLDSQAQSDRVLEALIAVFSLMAIGSPRLIVVENAQDMDESSIELFNRLLSRAKELPISLLFLTRNEDFFARMTVPKSQFIRLQAFTRDEIAELVKKRFKLSGSGDLIDFLATRTDGVPLYLQELLRYLREKGLLYTEAETVRLRSVDASVLPSSLEALILSQIDRLPQKTKAVLSAAAVLGQRIEHPVLTEMIAILNASGDKSLPAGQQENKDILDALASASILNAIDDGVSEFTKSLLRDSLYKLQFDRRLQELHGAAADSLLSCYPEDADRSAQKAYHLERSDRPDEARKFYRLAADAALYNYQNSQAMRYLECILELSNDDREKAEVYLDMAKILEVTGDWDQARRRLELGVGLATISGEEGMYQQFFSMLGQISFRRGNTGQAKSYFEKALRRGEYDQVTEAMVEVRLGLARSLMREARNAEALSRLFESRDLAREKGYRAKEAQILYHLGQIYRSSGESERAVEALEESHRMFVELNLIREIANPLYDLGQIYMNSGRLGESRETFSKILETYSQIGYKSGLAAALINLGAIEDQVGNFQAASDHYRRSRNIAQEIEEAPALGYALFCLGSSAYKAGEYTQAISYLNDAFKIFRDIDLRTYFSYPLSYLVATNVRMGEVDQALDEAQELLKIIHELGEDGEHGRIFLSLGELFERKLPLSDKNKQSVKHIARLAGMKFVSAQALYRKAIEESRNPKYINTLIPALYSYGRVLMASADHAKRESGRTYVQRAVRECRSAGWESYLGRILKQFPEIE